MMLIFTLFNFFSLKGLDSSTLEIQEGFFSRTGASEVAPDTDIHPDYGICPKGFYCPAGTAEPYPCPNGTYG